MLPHLKKENNAAQQPFVSIDQEIASLHQDRHPVTPARDVPNTALDKKEPQNDAEATNRS
jgi:hypothetical protein